MSEQEADNCKNPNNFSENIKPFLTELYITIKILVKVFLGLFFSLVIVGWSTAVIVITPYWFVNVLATLLFFYVWLGFWVLLFKKTTKRTKIIYAILFTLYMPVFKQANDVDWWVEHGYAPKGMFVYGKIMNEKVCEEMKFTWDRKKNACDTRKLKI